MSDEVTTFDDRREVTWGVPQVLLGVCMAIGFSVLGLLLVAIFDPELDTIGALIAAQATLAVALIAAAALAAAPGNKRASAFQLGLRKPSARFVGPAIIAYVVYVACAVVLAILIAPEQEDIARELGLGETVLASVAAGFFIIAVAPVAEEIFFRGFVFAGLATRMPMLIAALVSSAGWALVHLPQGSIGVVIQLTVFGVLLSWLYHRTGSLWPSIVVHAFNNALAFSLLAGAG